MCSASRCRRTKQAKANDWDQPGEFNFPYELGMAPSFDVDLSEKLGVEMPVVDVDDALLDNGDHGHAAPLRTVEDVEARGDKDMVLGDLIELDANGKIKEGGMMNRTTISLGRHGGRGHASPLDRKAVGDEAHGGPAQGEQGP